MAKTNPIGVRFDENTLELIKKEQNLSSPQRVLNYLLSEYLRKDLLPPKINNIEKIKLTTAETTKAPESPKNSNKQPPHNLSGIDLAIWKMENQ